MKRKSTKVEPQRRFTIPDNTPLVQPSQVVSGQWQPGFILHACPITEEGRTFFDLNDEKLIAVINPEGDGAGLACSQSSNQNALPEEELDSMKAREFGEKLCEKTATHWAAAQLNDETSKIAVKYIGAGVSVGDITEEVIPETVDKKEVKRLVSQGELTELPNSHKLLVQHLSIEPANSDDRNPGRFERLLGEEPVRTYVP